MGSLLFLFLCYYAFFGRNNPKLHRAAKNMAGGTATVFGGCLTLTVGLIVISVVAGIFGALSWMIPFIAVGCIISALTKSGKDKKMREKSEEYQTVKETRNAGNAWKLTKSADKRARIVSKFSKKFNLHLTDDQVELIMNASYVSYNWEKEVYDMSQSYSVPAEWYSGETDWLRAYLAVFPVMDISSDFLMQKKIVKDSFLEVFKAIPQESAYTTNDLIKWINNKFMLNFDEVSFRIAHRFLEEHGHSITLPASHILRNESEIEKLAKQYDAAEKAAQETEKGELPL